MLREEWDPAFLFAGFDEETKTYEKNYVPMGYSVALENLSKKI